MRKTGLIRKTVMLCLSASLFTMGLVVANAPSIRAAPALKSPIAPAEPHLRLIKSDVNGVVLELHTPTYEVEEKQVDGTVYHLLSVAGYGWTAEVGKPQLPVKMAMLGIPVNAHIELRILESECSIVPEKYNVYPTPKAIADEMAFDEGMLDDVRRYQGIKLVFARDQDVYSTDAFYPSELARMSSSGFIRDQHFVQLALHPLQYNPVTRQLRLCRKMQVELRFTYEEGEPSTPGARGIEARGGFENLLDKALLNYDSARDWRAQRTPRSHAEVLEVQEPSYKVAVNQDGIYQLSYAELQSAGVPVDSVDPRTFKLYNHGSEVAIHVVGEGDGSFNPADYILFYGQKMNTKYTDTNIYWLNWGGSGGLRMVEKDGTPSGTATVPTSFRATLHLEEDHFYQSTLPWGEGDHWYWNYVDAAGSSASQSYNTTLNHIATAPFSDTLRGLLHGLSSQSANPDHHTKVYLNGHLVDDATWDGKIPYEFQASIPQLYVLEGSNVISVECSLDLPGIAWDFVFTNWFDLEYHDTYVAENDSLRFGGDETGTWEYQVSGFTISDVEVFEITDPTNVARIVNGVVEEGGSYTLRFEDTIAEQRNYLAQITAQRLVPFSIIQDVPSDLHSTANAADYIIITHADFWDAVQPLVSHRAGQGLRVMVVDVQDVYDEFSYGIFDAQAIHDFLAYAYTNWQPPAPSYVLLVGDGNYDPKNNFGTSSPTYIPPYLMAVDPFTNETASDNRYVTVSGEDTLPDMHIGRLPVNSSAEAQVVVSKVLNYEQNPPAGDWNQRGLFVADNADAAGDFATLSDDIADNYLPYSYTSQKVYYKITHSTPAEVKAAIIEAINDGRLLVNYIGHSTIIYWAAEKLFDVVDIPSLANGAKQPMMLPMTCATGYFHHPSVTLDESLIRAEGKGAIASWSPTGFGLAAGHHYLNQGFFTAVFTDTISEIGTATYLGKLKLYTETGGEASPYRDLMDTFLLFGDPFMKLNLPACDAGDYDNDGHITVGDIMQVAYHWNTRWGDALFDRKYDLDDDGDVDIVDIMRVAAQWDKTC